MLALGFALLLLVTGGFADDSDSVNGDGPARECPYKYDNICYLTIPGSFDYDGGVAACEEHEGHLANIYSQAHMEDVMKYIRENVMGEDPNFVGFRLGMKYDPKANKLTLRDGSKAPSGLKWAFWYPNPYAAATTTVLNVDVESDPTQIFAKYLINVDTSYKSYSLCEIA